MLCLLLVLFGFLFLVFGSLIVNSYFLTVGMALIYMGFLNHAYTQIKQDREKA